MSYVVCFQFDSSTNTNGLYFSGGGGGGGILFDGSGPPANSVTLPNPYGQNGIGFGAGGGSGTYNGGFYTAGGNGAPGFVYVEWD